MVQNPFLNKSVDIWGVGCILAGLVEYLQPSSPDPQINTILGSDDSTSPLSAIKAQH